MSNLLTASQKAKPSQKARLGWVPKRESLSKTSKTRTIRQALECFGQLQRGTLRPDLVSRLKAPQKAPKALKGLGAKSDGQMGD